MKSYSHVKNIGFAAVVLLALAGCRNEASAPTATQNRADTTAPGNGAGNSTTGATGGSATTPGSDSAGVAGVTSPGTATGTSPGTGSAVGGAGNNVNTSSGTSAVPSAEARPNEQTPAPSTR